MSTIRVEGPTQGVTRVVLSRPEVLNAFDETMIGELADTFERLATDDSTRVTVLAAEGRLFCAGADIGWMQRQAAASPEANYADSLRFAGMLKVLHECPKPVIVRVHGHAFGGGVGLMAAADIVIAARGARFGITEAKFGILPAVIGPYIIQALGKRQAQRLAMTTQNFDADEALRLGLVHEVTDPDALDAAVERTAQTLMASGPGALSEIKSLYRELQGRAIDPAVCELTAKTNARVRATEEAREGFEAFMQKRKASWLRS